MRHLGAMAKQKDDHYTHSGARALADRIAAFWHARGFLVRVEPFQIPGFDMWGIRSNLTAGLPGRARR